MASHGWRKSPSVEAWLFDEGHRFDFYKAVALLEALHRELEPESPSVGEGAEPSREAVRFRSTLSLSFPAPDVDSIERPRHPEDPAPMTVNFMGLAGALGPLPPPFAELIYRRAHRRDTAARDFLDIFNHRLVSLAYRIRKRHRIGLGAPSPEADDAARYLFAILGLGAPALRERLGVPDRLFLFHAGITGRQIRSMAGLEAILRDHFRAPIEAVPLTGRFHRLEDSDCTRIGPSGNNRRLGQGAVLGRRIFDFESTFELRVGPLGYREFLRFLPGGDALSALCSITRFYAGPTFDFTVLVAIREEEAPQARLGLKYDTRLGYSSWIGKRAAKTANRIRLRGAVIS